MVINNWNINKDVDLDKAKALAKQLNNIDLPLAKILIQRGIDSFDKAKSFFRPSLENLYSPFLMKDMDKAVDRLSKSISNNEKILIYGDYDVDGTTAIALLLTFLKKFSNNVDYYVPDRYKEGYGVSEKGIDFAIENKFDLMITVDCGIKANKQINRAVQAGIDVIVCDHHEQGSDTPNAFALLDPKQNKCDYPFKGLSGCGVAFKFLQGFCEKNNISQFDNLYTLLDFVVVSIASDIVPIIDENRILASFGLKLVNSSPSLGIKTLKEFLKLENTNIEINDIVFKFAPRINSAGRINSARHAVELLIAENESSALAICEEVEMYNNTRKEIESNITKEALKMIENDDFLLNAKSTVLFSEKWSKGVVGIVASSLIETYFRPTIIFTKTGDMLSGSARSVPGFNLYEAVEHCEDLIESYGGHFYAVGLNIKAENFDAFRKKFNDFVSKNLTKEQSIPSISIDTELNLSDITPKFYRLLQQMGPFGPGNMTPVFMSKNLSDSSLSKIVGKTADHLKLSIIQHDKDKNIVDAIAFGYGHLFNEIKNKKFHLCYNITENEFLNTKSLQLFVKDIKVEQ